MPKCPVANQQHTIVREREQEREQEKERASARERARERVREKAHALRARFKHHSPIAAKHRRETARESKSKGESKSRSESKRRRGGGE